MNILLIQPAQERGLGFRSLAVVEPLGLEAVAGALPEHRIRILDLRLEDRLLMVLKEFRPDFCGINCSFTIDVYQTREIAARIKAWDRSVSVFIGGHHASLSPQDFSTPAAFSVAGGFPGSGLVGGAQLSGTTAAAIWNGRNFATSASASWEPTSGLETSMAGSLSDYSTPKGHKTIAEQTRWFKRLP
jgi:hypothetical protein